MITPDEFDAELESIEPETTTAVVSRKPNSVIKDLIVNPEVVKALVSGVPPKEIAEQLGVAEATVRKWMTRMEMKDLLKIESKRVVRHLSRRNLSKEKYLGLATAVGVMIDKVEMLENGVPKPPAGSTNTTIIQNIQIGLFGRRRREAGAANSTDASEPPGEGSELVPEGGDSG